MGVEKEWIKEYHTPTVGTRYHIVTKRGFIRLRAIDKPYKLTASAEDLKEIAE